MYKLKFIFFTVLIYTFNFLNAQTITNTYDSLGRLTKVIFPDSSIIKYLYDAVGNRINKVIIASPYITWTGLTNKDWATSTNWSTNTVPISTDNVLIPVTTNQPIISKISSAITNNITINYGASVIDSGSLQINGSINNSGNIEATAGLLSLSGSSLQVIPASLFSNNIVQKLTINNSAGVVLAGPITITGLLTPTNGLFATSNFLTLASSSSGTASIAQGSGSYLTGTITVQRYVGSNLQWRMVGFPFIASTSLSQSTLSSFYTSGYNAYTYNESADNGNYGNSGAVNAGWQQFNNGTVTSDKGILLSGGAIASVINFNGTVNTGNQNVNLSYSTSNKNKGWNLIANPYPSNINWTTIIANNPSGLQNAIYRYDPSTTAYAAFVNGANAGNQSNIIENGAGFFVHSTGATSLIIQESDKTSNTPIASLFGFDPIQNKSIIKLRLIAEGENSGDEVVVRWGVDPATDNFDDKFDAYDLGRSKGADLSVIGSDGSLYSIFHGSALQTKDKEHRIIALGIKNMKVGSYTFKSKLLSPMFDGNEVFIVDHYTNQTALVSTDSASYTIKVTSDSGSASVNRFSIALNPKQTISTTMGEGILLLNNPSHLNQFNIVLGSDYQMVNWELIDNTGRVLQSGIFSGVSKGNVNIAQTPNLIAGTYFIKLIGDGKSLPTQKWLKE